jgi:hypothetical protein
MRVYDIRLSNCNDDTVAFWSNLSAETMITILTTIVPIGSHFISVNVILKEDPK